MPRERIKYRRLGLSDEKKPSEKKETKKPKKNKPKKKYESERPFRYSDVVYGKDGYADAKEYKPDKFDLVFMLIERLGQKKTVVGWWTGSDWYSQRLLEGDKVLRWTRNEQYRSLK